MKTQLFYQITGPISLFFCISLAKAITSLQLLLLTHIAHSFVLLTANVDDVKKIARKFVSESLAEKIADFIARATETMAQNTKNSEENPDNGDVRGSAQVSAENRMYSAERHGLDIQAAEAKSKEDIVLGKVTAKVPEKTSDKKKRQEFEDPGATHKPRKEPKPLHGRSRYIVQSEQASLATEKAVSNISEDDKYNKMKESIQFLEDKLLSSTSGKTKAKKPKKKVKGRAYKLLSGFEPVENDAAKGGTPDSNGPKDNERFFNLRAFDDGKVLSTPTEEVATGTEKHVIENEKQTEKAASVFDQSETKDDKNTEMVAINGPVHPTGKDEFDHDENKIIEKAEKVVMSGSRSFAAKTDVKDENWWEKELPAHAHEVNGNGKSWF